MNGVISDHTAHIYLAQDPSVTTSSGAFCGDYTTYSTSVLSKKGTRGSSHRWVLGEIYVCSVVRDDPIHYNNLCYV